MESNGFSEELAKIAKESKSPEELAAKAKDIGFELTAEQAEAILKQVKARAEAAAEGKLSDMEMENVAGGITPEALAQRTEQKNRAAAEGRTVFCWALFSEYLCCTGCSLSGAVYARKKLDIKHGLDEYRDCKCYWCNTEIGHLNTLGFKVK
jgi:hypothetical protein